MTPPSLDSAREILSAAATQARSSGDPVAELAAAAIDVVLASLDARARLLQAFDRDLAAARAAAPARARTEAERMGDNPPPLPCPFCGRTDLLGVEPSPESGFLMVKCRACGGAGPAWGHNGPHGRAEAIAHWNRRSAALGSVEPVAPCRCADPIGVRGTCARCGGEL